MIRLVVPADREGRRGSGQWKDLQGIRLALDRLGAEWREFRFDGDNAGALAGDIAPGARDTVIWYYSFWPEALEALKRDRPRVRAVLRTVNAEALQHWTRASKDWRRPRGLPRDVYGFFRLLWRDRRCARAADALAGISAWDDARYWRRLAGPGKVRTVSYLSPWPRLRPAVTPLPWERREPTIVCLAGARDPIGRAHLGEFARLAEHPGFSGWTFAASAGLAGDAPDLLPPRVRRLGCLDEPWDLLCRVRAVAVLSPLGYGYKTTIADALAAGCHVLVHPRQHARLTPGERARTIPVCPAAADAASVTGRLARPPAPGAEGAEDDPVGRAAAAWGAVCAS